MNENIKDYLKATIITLVMLAVVSLLVIGLFSFTDNMTIVLSVGIFVTVLIIAPAFIFLMEELR